MPYVSDRQRRWAHTASAKNTGFPTAEYDRASKGKKLPERAKFGAHIKQYATRRRKHV